MDRILAFSIVLQIAAAAWAALLLWRFRDWRLAFLTLLLVLMAVRRVLRLIASGEPAGTIGPMPFPMIEEGFVLAISCFSIAAVGFLHGSFRNSSRGQREWRLLASALSDSATPVMITDADAGPQGPSIVFVNDSLCRLTGYPREELIGRRAFIICGRETQLEELQRIGSAAHRGVPFLGETLTRRKNGSTLWTSCAISPVKDPSGKTTHLLWIKQDVTERRIADQQLRDALQKLSFHVDNSPLAVIEWDREFRVATWSSGAERIFGWSADEVIGRHPSEWRIIHEEDAAHVAEVINRLNTGAEPRNLCLNRNYTKSGDVIWCQWYNSVLFDQSGRVNSVLSLAQDVTERHRADERQRLLMLELDHRVKNNLATVLGIAQQTRAAAATIDQFTDAFIGRVEALARAHGLLARASWEGVDIRALSERILESALVADPPQVAMRGEPILLSASQGSIIALTLHELMTNAVKYGALSTPAGRVDLSWRTAPAGGAARITLEWRESGGPPVRAPERDGFGATFIRTGVAYELRGESELVYDATGLICRITFPMEPPTAAPVEAETRGGAA